MKRGHPEAVWAAFLRGVEAGDAIGHAARAAGIGRTTVYDRAGRDRKFAEALREAEAAGAEVLEQAAVQRALHGVVRQTFYQGETVPGGEYRQYSDSLLALLLKARNPAKFKDHLSVDATVHVDYAHEILAARRRVGWPIGTEPELTEDETDDASPSDPES